MVAILELIFPFKKNTSSPLIQKDFPEMYCDVIDLFSLYFLSGKYYFENTVYSIQEKVTI